MNYAVSLFLTMIRYLVAFELNSAWNLPGQGMEKFELREEFFLRLGISPANCTTSILA